MIDDEDREALIDRAREVLRRADATLRAPRPNVGALEKWASLAPHNATKEPKQMASYSPEYITKADARESQDRVEQAIGIIVARQRDALEQRSASLFDLIAELDARWSAIEARIAKLEAAMSIAPTSSDDATH